MGALPDPVLQNLTEDNNGTEIITPINISTKFPYESRASITLAGLSQERFSAYCAGPFTQAVAQRAMVNASQVRISSLTERAVVNRRLSVKVGANLLVKFSVMSADNKRAQNVNRWLVDLASNQAELRAFVASFKEFVLTQPGLPADVKAELAFIITAENVKSIAFLGSNAGEAEADGLTGKQIFFVFFVALLALGAILRYYGRSCSSGQSEPETGGSNYAGRDEPISKQNLELALGLSGVDDDQQEHEEQ
jgi:hypothetical protein